MRVGDRDILRRFQALEAELRGVKDINSQLSAAAVSHHLPSPILELPPNLELSLPTPTASDADPADPHHPDFATEIL